jgi:hypothetical protein
MAKTPINEQFIKMQKLAGVITESQYNRHISEVLGLAGMHKPIMDWDNMPKDIKIDLIAPYVEDGTPEDYINLGLGHLPKPMADAVMDYFNNAGSEGMMDDNDYQPQYDKDMMDDDDYNPQHDSDMDLGNPYGDDLYESKKDKKQKITKSQLKETIRREILAALTEDSDLTEEEEEDITLDAETEDVPANDSEDVAPTSGGSVEEVQRDLTAALNSAKQLGDKKLVRQIGNALTYFTRQQISSEEM